MSFSGGSNNIAYIRVFHSLDHGLQFFCVDPSSWLLANETFVIMTILCINTSLLVRTATFFVCCCCIVYRLLSRILLLVSRNF